MEDIDRYLVALEKASQNADRALGVAFSGEFADYPEVERHTLAAAAIIHCDILRYLIAYQSSTSKGVVRLLWAGDIVCTLYEAKKWFFQTGGRNLRSIASYNGYDIDQLGRQLKELKDSFPLGGIDAYKNFRNRAGHHYDADFAQHFRSFSQMEFDEFYNVLLNYVRFAHEWLKLSLAVVKHGHPPAA